MQNGQPKEDERTRLWLAREALGRMGGLSACPDEFSAALLGAGRLRDLTRGEAVHHTGDVEGGIWGIAAGFLISSTGVAGANISLTSLFGPGEWGGLGPISGFARHLDLSAREPATLLVVPEPAVRRLLYAQPGWWAHINRLSFQTMVKFGLLAADLQTVDHRARVAAMLLNAAGLRLEGNAPATVAMSQRELGRMANLSHYPTGRILRGFVADGLVSTRYGRISIDRPAQLRDVAEGS